MSNGLKERKNLIIIGAGRNAAVVIDIIKARRMIFNEELEIVGVLDDSSLIDELLGIKRIGCIDEISKFASKDIVFVNALGDNSLRKKVFVSHSEACWYSLIHPTAIISDNVSIGEGCVIMPGVIINSGTSIGKQCLINSGAIVEHDNIIGDYSHIASGVVTAGNVEIGNETLIGTGTSIRQGIRIGNRCTIGTGSVVVKDIKDNSIAYGVPASIKVDY